MKAWNVLTNSSKDESYIDYVIHFKSVCEKYPYFLNYVRNYKYQTWEVIDTMIVLQHNDIHTYVGQSITILEHKFKNKTFYFS